MRRATAAGDGERAGHLGRPPGALERVFDSRCQLGVETGAVFRFS